LTTVTVVVILTLLFIHFLTKEDAMSISVLRSARWVFSVMAVAVFSALVLVGCGKDDDDTGGGGDWNGSYKGDLWVDSTLVSDDQNNLGIAVVSGGNTIKITGSGIDVTFKFGALTKAPKEDIPKDFTFVEAYAASIDGGGTVTFLSGTQFGNLLVLDATSGDNKYHFVGGSNL
jgi:hypothetical protein